MIKLNLGCGLRKIDGYINIDNLYEVNPDVVWNVLDGFKYADSSVDEVRAFDFLEHIPIGKTVKVVEEIYRVLKPGGKFESFTPDVEHGQGAFQDPTHVSFWCENSWLYYTVEAYRNLYGIKANFDIQSFNRVNTNSRLRVYHLHVMAVAVKNG